VAAATGFRIGPYVPPRLTGYGSKLGRISRMSAQICRAWLATRARGGRFDAAIASRRFVSWSEGILKSLNVTTIIDGADLHEDSVMLLSNHVSWLDICVIGAITGARFVAKHELRDWPVIGDLAARFGSLFHVRGHCRDAWRVKEGIARALARRERVAVFPEGTTTDGTVVGFFYPAMVQAAIDARACVQPVAIRYLNPDGSPNQAVPFIGSQSFADSLKLIVGEPQVIARLTFCAPIDTLGLERREVAALARSAVARVLGVEEITHRADPGKLFAWAGGLAYRVPA